MSLAKGLNRELELSKSLHANHIPLLISPSLLRSRGCGQVDIAYLLNSYHSQLWDVFLIEIKSSGHVSRRQMRRLSLSSQFVSQLFSGEIQLKVLS